MSTHTLERSITLPASAAEAFHWHERPGALQRLIPPWEQVQVVQASGGIQDGGQVELVAKLGVLRLRWLAEHSRYNPPGSFFDVQKSGPFASWEHTHRFEALGAHECRLIDHVEYRLRGGIVGEWLGGAMVKHKLDQMFAYRHRTTAHDLSAHAQHPEQAAMHIVVTGASGLVGGELVPFLTTGGHTVTKLVRRTAGEGESHWDPAAGVIDSELLSTADAVIHLAGDNIAEGRWTKAKKQRINDSRVNSTKLLAEALAKLKTKPKVLVCASAIGFYGDRGPERLDENSPPGTGFLPQVCQAWEDAAQPAREAGIRVVNLRFGVILSPKGGALAKMLFPFKMGGGGVLGSGRQYWSWIAMDDVIGATHHALMTDTVSGPVNVVAPYPATNRDFTKALGRVLGRPTIVPLPSFAARMLLGEMADALLLASQHVLPKRLEATGYQFRHPELEEALRALLGKT